MDTQSNFSITKNKAFTNDAIGWKDCNLNFEFKFQNRHNFSQTNFPRPNVVPGGQKTITLGFGPCTRASPTLSATVGLKTEVIYAAREFEGTFQLNPFSFSNQGCASNDYAVTGAAITDISNETVDDVATGAKHVKINILKDATLGDYELEIKGVGKYVMFRDIEAVSPKIKIKVTTMISGQYLELKMTENSPDDLI